jgi:anti-anti-sigma factor
MLRVGWFPGREKTVVAVEGDMDESVCAAFLIGARHAAARTASEVVVDLGKVTSIDESGCEALVELRRMLERSGVAMRLTNVGPELESVISNSVRRFDRAGARPAA